MMSNYALYLRFALITFSALIFTIFQGCAVKLQQIEEFSKSTVTASSSFGIVSNDIPKSCYRRIKLEFQKSALQDPDKINTLYTDFENTCQALSKSLNGINTANEILKGYAESLGKLAAEDAVDFSTELNNIETNLKNIEIKKGIKPFEQNQRFEAVSALAKFLFNLGFKAYQKELLVETIEAAHKDEAIYKLVDGLKSVISDYTLEKPDNILSLEREVIVSLKEQYDEKVKLLTALIRDFDTGRKSQRVKLCTRAKDNLDTSPYKEFCNDIKNEVVELSTTSEGIQLANTGRLSLEELVRHKVSSSNLYEERDLYLERLSNTISNIDEINHKQQAASKAIMTLDGISSTHRKLYENRRRIDSKELFMTIKEFGGQVKDLISQIKVAFGKPSE